MDQSIAFKDATDQIRMLSGRERSEDAIKAYMNQPKYGLDKVDGTFGVFASGMEGSRTSCDTCLLLGSTSKGAFPDTTCIRYKNSSTLKGDATDTVRSAEETRETLMARSGLTGLPVADIPKSLQSFNQNMRKPEGLGRLRTMAVAARTKTTSKSILMTLS
ncbi:hypothetical protein EJ02DRAFT_417815 [Clathrospora elynae]|uniref:Uncharacterized protein n=1 Tax=Clathrospora elynae TaxID=706981 RepID=A0A6A5T3P2_9PLEO|nr:hypothetical protein EJ02DRAFT_417815 [Clathrospora elynae]